MPSNSLTLLIIPISGVLLGILTAWLASLTGRAFRFLADHPWRVFWLLGNPLVWASLVFDIYLPFIDSSGASIRPFQVMSETFMGATLLVLGLSAIQGLRVTWLRSRWKGSSLLILWLFIPLLETFSIPRGEADFLSHFYTAISLSPSWALAAWVTHVVALRLRPMSTVASPEVLPEWKEAAEISQVNARLPALDPSQPARKKGILPVTFGEAERVARLYRRLVVLFGVGLILSVPVGRLPVGSGMAVVEVGALVVTLALFIGLLVTSYRLTTHLGSHSPVIWAIGMCIPLVNLFVLLAVSAKAQAWCKRHGIRVGLLGLRGRVSNACEEQTCRAKKSLS